MVFLSNQSTYPSVNSNSSVKRSTIHLGIAFGVFVCQVLIFQITVEKPVSVNYIDQVMLSFDCGTSTLDIYL